MDVASRPHGALLVGSMGLPDVEEALRQAATQLGDRLNRIPDGEPGNRKMWITWQHAALERVAGLEKTGPLPGWYPPLPKFRLQEGVDAGDVDLGTLGYAEEAARSWETFERLARGGVIPDGVRFMVALPTPFASSRNAHPDDRDQLTPAFDRAIRRALSDILDRVPHERLAIQWDVCHEVGWWDRPFMHFADDDPRDEATQSRVLDRLAELGELVPGPVELGYHICYGDFGGRHSKEPDDLGVCVAIASGLARRQRRSINWVHMPVPIDRDDTAYFEPLEVLDLPAETEVYLGLVHERDGVEGTRRRIATASRFLQGFGVAAECGLGRRQPDQAIDAMRVHREVCDPVRA